MLYVLVLACVCVLHPGKDVPLLVSSSSRCCSGLARCIYLKVVQREGRSFGSVCKCQILEMQRVYIHSSEHFQVFTTVLAPQGELNRVCSGMWRGMTLLMLSVKARWHSNDRWLINHGVDPFPLFFTPYGLFIYWSAGGCRHFYVHAFT